MRGQLQLRLGVVLVAALIATSVTGAWAQTSSPTAVVPPAPVTGGIFQVQVAPDATAGQGAVVVAVQLPPTAKLPAMVQIPVPTGTTVTWVGEILGGDPSADLQRAYTTVQGTGGQVLEVTLEETRSAQAEFTAPSTAGTSGKASMNVTWVQAAPSIQTEFSVRMPAGATQVQITPTPEAAPVTNAVGEMLYPLPTKVMKLGDTTVVSVSFAVGQAGQQGQTSGTASSPVFWILVAALFLVLALLGFSLMSRRSRGQ